MDEGTEPHEVLILLKSDKSGKLSKQLDEMLTGLGVAVYQPRLGAGPDPEIEQVFEFLVLASSVALGGPTDDLSVRALLELRPNSIGATRIGNAVAYCP